MKLTKKQKTEIKKFRNYIKENRKIRTKLKSIAGWTQDDFHKIINLLEKGEKENEREIEKLKKVQLTTIQAEDMFKKEIAEGTINTETTPHYDSFIEYCDMLENLGFNIEE